MQLFPHSANFENSMNFFGNFSKLLEYFVDILRKCVLPISSLWKIKQLFGNFSNLREYFGKSRNLFVIFEFTRNLLELSSTVSNVLDCFYSLEHFEMFRRTRIMTIFFLPSFVKKSMEFIPMKWFRNFAILSIIFLKTAEHFRNFLNLLTTLKWNAPRFGHF